MSAPEAVFDEEAVEAARVLFAHPVSFMMGCAAIEQLPPPNLPEIAFAGRSNVGKSSLINALVGRTAWRAPPTSRDARARSISSCWTTRCGWSTCRATASPAPPRRRRQVPEPGPRLSARKAEPEAGLSADRRAPWPEGAGRRSARRLGLGGGVRPAGADQGRQDQAGRTRENRRRHAQGDLPPPRSLPPRRGHFGREGDRLAGTTRGDRPGGVSLGLSSIDTSPCILGAVTFNHSAERLASLPLPAKRGGGPPGGPAQEPLPPPP